ncbi:UrcA family protein [Sphingobium sp. H39-3-25]|uniref:UrcA family protein n=1 Tax=Sphingobium arseniciresistens TaxID=3030834 RepID=UPI0023B8EC0D|nr:UrcA family protein [Sphingobium arseniciresistens]
MHKTLMITGAALLLLPVSTMASSANWAGQLDDSEMVVTGQSGQATRSMRVSLADLDLRQDRGVTRAGHRIRYAAKTVCGADNTRDLYLLADYRRCYDGAYSGAQRDLSALVSAARAG